MDWTLEGAFIFQQTKNIFLEFLMRPEPL